MNQGDTVKVAMTNIEQTTDELHGWGLLDYNINIVVDPGEDEGHVQGRQAGRLRLLLHELLLRPPPGMQGYLVVKPKG